MAMLSKVMAKGRTALPPAVIEKLGLKAGDLIAFEIEGDVVRMPKVEASEVDCLRALQATLSEWQTLEDAEAYDDL